jgi:acetamidase/formamidase
MSTNHWSSVRRRSLLGAGLSAPLVAAFAGRADAAGNPSPITPGRSTRPIIDHHLRSTPDHLHWGGFPIDWDAALTMKSGEVVRIDVLSHQGATQATHPIEYFGAFGAGPEVVLDDVIEFWKTREDRMATQRRYSGGHIMTGPIYVEGAKPGDTIAIEILEFETRTPYGFNNTSSTGGVMSTTYPGWRAGDPGLDIPNDTPPNMPAGVWPDVKVHMYRVDDYLGKQVVYFNDDIKIPAHPFMGIMAVAPKSGEFIGNTETAPPPVPAVQGSTPPGSFGGNMDVRDLTVGTTLYLPVWQPGAQVFMGDSHSCQGDGEVSGTAVEHSLSGVFRITLIKNVATELPWAETDDHWIMMGIHWDLDRAMRQAVKKTVDFLVTTHGLTAAKAYSFASIAVNYHAAEVVDRTQVVTGHIPKNAFKGRP